MDCEDVTCLSFKRNASSLLGTRTETFENVPAKFLVERQQLFEHDVASIVLKTFIIYTAYSNNDDNVRAELRN